MAHALGVLLFRGPNDQIDIPGPPKYVKSCAKTTKNSPKGNDFTYFGGPGKDPTPCGF